MIGFGRRRSATAHVLADEALHRLGCPPSVLEQVFSGVRTNFSVTIADRLPLGIDRAGMAGITLGRRVFLTVAASRLPPLEFLVLLRHEAEHVAQQDREPLMFYVKYAGAWFSRFLRARGVAGIGERWHTAYRAIPAELEAVAAGERARQLLWTRGFGAAGAG